ncbi:hypothetical protein [Candidatus Mycoplasma haematohominis]|uniref:hypothetical protein n=1 Tax=Candidatus Mycoplasma haematohominis TaxID=1494318 RepID=UPI001C0A7365|nr:hypothetical protein [Candidatus Mycoplasma haemohominis]
MDPVKGAAGLGAVALVVGGGYALKGGLDSWTPEVSFLSKMDEATFKKDYTNDKFGKKYAKYLTDPNKNESWWKKKYDEVLKNEQEVKGENGQVTNNNNLSSEFQKGAVSKGFDSKDTNALNKVCEAAFKKDLTDIKPSSGTNTDKDKYRAGIWKYCTIFEKELLTVKDASNSSSYDGSKLGKTEEDVLADTKSENNKIFWERKQQEFFFGGTDKKGIGSKATADKAFGDLYKKKDSKEKEVGALKGVCETVYDKEDNDLKNEVILYCSLFEKDSQ